MKRRKGTGGQKMCPGYNGTCSAPATPGDFWCREHRNRYRQQWRRKHSQTAALDDLLAAVLANDLERARDLAEQIVRRRRKVRKVVEEELDPRLQRLLDKHAAEENQ